MGPVFRVVRMNEDHPEDPDPQYWGHSIGWYENGDTLEYDIVVDDPWAYAAPWPGHRNFVRSTTGFMRYMWVCSVRDNNAHYEKTTAAGNDGATTFK
jgi:hypothetical protein